MAAKICLSTSVIFFLLFNFCPCETKRLILLTSGILETSHDWEISRSHVPNTMQCAKLCLRTLRCQSLFYSQDDHSCQLHSVILESFRSPLTISGMDYYKVAAENGDCVPTWKWQGDVYRHYSTKSTTWPEAKALCDCIDGYLVKIESQEENEIVLNTFIEDGGDAVSDLSGYWLGASNNVDEPTWKWQDGTDVTWTDWADNEPDHDYQHYLAVYFSRHNKWVNHFGASLGFVCEKTIE